MKNLKIWGILLASFGLAFLSACNEDEKDKKLITFHVANSRNISTGIARSMVKMPASGLTLVADNDQFMYSGDLKCVNVAKVIMETGEPLLGLYFECEESGRKKLFQATGGNMGSYLLMKFEGAPLALRLIDSPIQDGYLFMVPEFPPDTDIHKKVEEMNASIKVIHKIKERAKKSEWF